MAKKSKRPRDSNQLAKNIVDIATGESEDKVTQDDLKSAAALLGRKGGLKGGKARAKSLSSKRRSEIARGAAAARWNKSYLIMTKMNLITSFQKFLLTGFMLSYLVRLRMGNEKQGAFWNLR